MDNNQFQNNQGYDPQGQSYQNNGQQYDAQQQYYQQQYEMQQQYYQQLYEQQQYDMQQAANAQQQYGQQASNAQQQYDMQASNAQQYDMQQAGQPVQQNNQYNQASNSGNSGGNGGKKKTGLIIGIIAAVVLVAVAIIVVILLKNKKSDKKEKDTTEAVTTESTASTEETTEITTEATTEETTEEIAANMRYYKLVDLDDGSGTDYSSMLQNYHEIGEYSFAVFDDDNHTGYFVLRMEYGGSFTFNDSTMTMDDIEDDIYNLTVNGDTLIMEQGGQSLTMERVSEEEFKKMNDAYENGESGGGSENTSGIISVGTVLSEDTMVKLDNISVKIPSGYMNGYDINPDSTNQRAKAQLVDPDKGVVAYIYVDFWTHLDEDTAKVQYAETFYNEWTMTDMALDNGVVINYMHIFEENNYLWDQIMYEAPDNECNVLKYDGFLEHDNSLYQIDVYVDADFYGDEAENVALGLLNGITY